MALGSCRLPMQSAVAVASFQGNSADRTVVISDSIKRVTLCDLIVTTPTCNTTEWLEHELSPKVWSEKPKDTETSKRVYSIY